MARISKQHSLKNNKYHSIPSANPASHTELPGQGTPTPSMHGGDMLSMAAVPQPGSPMTSLFANQQSQGDS